MRRLNQHRLFKCFFSLTLMMFAGFVAESQAQKDKKAMLPDFDGLWNFGDPAGTETKFREILAEPDTVSDADYVVELETQIARTLGLQRKFEEAHAVLDSIEAKISTTSPRAQIRYLLEWGRVLNSSGKKKDSESFFLDALKLAEESGEENLAVDAAHMMGIVTSPDQQIDWSSKAIKMAEVATDEKARKWLGSLYNNTAWSLHDLKRYEEAMEYFQSALTYETELGREKRIRIAKWAVGRCKRSLGQLDGALAVQQALLEEYEFLDGTDGYVLEEIAECLHAQGIESDAEPWFAKAYEELAKDEWLVANESERLDRLKSLGRVK